MEKVTPLKEKKQTEVKGVSGLHYLPDVISPEEETGILKWLDAQKWAPLTIKVDTGRLVQQFGFRFNYHTYELVKDVPKIPEELASLIAKLKKICAEVGAEVGGEFNQIIVNSYRPGEGISPHTDAKSFGPTIGCFTLAAGGVMEFSPPNSAVGSKTELFTESRSLYVMSGSARSLWLHSMPARKFDMVNGKKIERLRRISVTCRHVPE